MLLGGALLIHVQGFPRIPGQQVGPGLFPGILGVGLAVCGLLLIVRGIRLRTAEPQPARSGSRCPNGRTHRVSASPSRCWSRSTCCIWSAVDRLGFVLTGTIYLAALMGVLRVRPSRIVPLALVLTLLIHYAFYKLLRVPLPWGVLQSVAW